MQVHDCWQNRDCCAGQVRKQDLREGGKGQQGAGGVFLLNQMAAREVVISWVDGHIKGRKADSGSLHTAAQIPALSLFIDPSKQNNDTLHNVHPHGPVLGCISILVRPLQTDPIIFCSTFQPTQKGTLQTASIRVVSGTNELIECEIGKLCVSVKTLSIFPVPLEVKVWS